MADDFVDETPTTLVFVTSNRRLLVDDNYDTIVSRLNVITHEPVPILKANVAGEEVTMLLGGDTIIVLSGDRRADSLLDMSAQ